jgi:hypothetical protein
MAVHRGYCPIQRLGIGGKENVETNSDQD